VQRKLEAAVGWCTRINDAAARASRRAALVHEWQGKCAHLAELLDFARLRPLNEASLQQRLI